MAKKWIAVSIVLLVVAVLLARQLYVSVERFNAENDPQKIQPRRDLKQKKALEGELRPPQPPRKYNASDFAVIPAQNLFSEFRGKTDPGIERMQSRGRDPEIKLSACLICAESPCRLLPLDRR